MRDEACTCKPICLSCADAIFAAQQGIGSSQFCLLSNTLPPTLLQELEVGLSINSLYAGGFAHADDIRMLATSDESLEAQVDLVKRSGVIEGDSQSLRTFACGNIFAWPCPLLTNRTLFWN